MLWGLLLAPYLVFGAIFGSAVTAHRLGWVYSETTRQTLISVFSGLAAGTVVALFVWPAAYLLEHVLRRSSAGRTGYRHLALGILTPAIYVHATIGVLDACELISREDPVPALVGNIFTAMELAAVPLLVVWLFLVISQRKR